MSSPKAVTAAPHAHRHNRLRQLRAFCHAAQTSSISRAAERLGLSQPSVSLQIQALERELGTLLFERRGPKISLTPSGQVLIEMAHSLVEGMDKLPEHFAARLGEINTGSLDIAAGESTILYLLPDFVAAFSQQHPRIDVRLHNVTGRDGMTMLRADEVDFAVGSMLDAPDDVSYQAVFTYDPMLIVPPKHPLSQLARVSLDDISPHGLILPPRHLSTWSIVDLVFKQHGVDYTVCLEAGGWEVIKRYVEIGMGISIVTSICLRGHENLVALPLDDYFPQRSYGIVIRRGKFLSPQAKRFIELLDPSFFTPGKPSPNNALQRAVGDELDFETRLG